MLPRRLQLKEILGKKKKGVIRKARLQQTVARPDEQLLPIMYPEPR